MKKFIQFFAQETKFTTFHIFSIAFFLLGTFVVNTATELGAFAPLLISLGIYIGIFAIMLQLIFWSKKLVRFIFFRKYK